MRLCSDRMEAQWKSRTILQFVKCRGFKAGSLAVQTPSSQCIWNMILPKLLLILCSRHLSASRISSHPHHLPPTLGENSMKSNVFNVVCRHVQTRKLEPTHTEMPGSSFLVEMPGATSILAPSSDALLLLVASCS